MAEVSVTKKKVSGPKHSVEHIHVRKMGNGYHVQHHIEAKMPPARGAGNMPMPPNQPEPMVFSGPKGAKMARAHVNDLMDQMGQGIGAGTGDGGGAGGNVAGLQQPEATNG